MQIIEPSTWNGHPLIQWQTQVKTGQSLSFLTVLPAESGKKMPWLMALHGYGSQKEEWLEMDGYTKGGNLVNQLVDAGYAVAMVDMDKHGENIPNGQTIDYEGLKYDPAGWDAFFSNTIENVTAVMAAIQKNEQFDSARFGFLGYSLGGMFGFWLANRGTAFKTMTVCVPPVLRELNNPYVLKNNLASLGSLPVLFIAGEQDDVTPIEDSRWLFDRLPMLDKRFLSYPCGHSLPSDYVPEAAAWIRQRL